MIEILRVNGKRLSSEVTVSCACCWIQLTSFLCFVVLGIECPNAALGIDELRKHYWKCCNRKWNCE